MAQKREETQKPMPFISIIIPIYNIEKYLPDCLDSLLRCDLSGNELLLIDDGSTDSSGRLCDAYAEWYGLFSVYHKVNGGLSDARNFGMDRASGEWIVFIDGDDSVEHDEYNKFTARLRSLDSDIDFVFNDYILCNLADNKETEMHQTDRGESDSLTDILKKTSSVWNAWRYVYRRSFIEERGMRFTKGIYAEDLDFNLRLFSQGEVKPSLVHIPYYRYSYNRSGSIMERGSIKLIEDVTAVIRKHYALFKGRRDLTARLLKRQLLREYLQYVPRYYQFNKSDKAVFRHCYRAKGSPLAVSPLWLAPLLQLLRKVYHSIK
jgi:glycosyltransferase involved in cell wall biosynthesis